MTTRSPPGIPYVSNSSLTFSKRQFYLNGKPFQLLGGSIHYFRILPEYWHERLKQLKACGLNTVTVYVPWNLHEVYPGEFQFTGRLNLRRFIEIAHELDLYVSFRPGPFICAEWEFGGLPSWLLKDPNMAVRSNYPRYTQAVERYFTRLLKEVADLQFSRGGPIIAVQVENEFGSYSNEVSHLAFLKQLLLKNGIVEMLFTSDSYLAYNMSGLDRAPFYTEALPTANFADIHQGYGLFLKILRMSEDFPLVVTEFWSGWFDHWGQGHNTRAVDVFRNTLKSLLDDGASVNVYMFHGGTNFGFTSGANIEKDGYQSDVTSYDYDTLVSEDGQLTQKYFAARDLIRTISLSAQGPMVIAIQDFMGLQEIISFVENPLTSVDPICMEALVWKDNGYGQNFGYIYYSTRISDNGNLTFKSTPTDRNEIFLDDIPLATHDANDPDLTVSIPPPPTKGQDMKLGILVENRGRVNYAMMPYKFFNEQRKGTFVLCLFKSCRDWCKGFVVINGFNLGRYWNKGPLMTLYLPKTRLKSHQNEVDQKI
ncbi:beta-galactosidase-1-like protein 2 [Ylistrum balloti]|uniref:beta-galactosidase-1-like protein 2 n=1 Tax=Ylistrum balloti TaxID=509963 RepID=UPI0029059583|nr:beta-galactosidase-1-like protein 2 [Ylistrum balloti]